MTIVNRRPQGGEGFTVNLSDLVDILFVYQPHIQDKSLPLWSRFLFLANEQSIPNSYNRLVSSDSAILQHLPSVHSLLETRSIQALVGEYSRELVLEEVQLYLAEVREQIRGGLVSEEQLLKLLALLASRVQTRLEDRLRPSLRKVINATGVIIHTNLGRSLLSQRARRAMVEAAEAYSNLEYDLAEGGRGSRYHHAESLLCRLTGAEGAVVVNNNAAALVLSSCPQ